MTTIRLLDARRGLNRKCEELFGNAKIAEAIYRFLCDGIEECEDAEPERKKGKWIPVTERLPEIDMTYPHHDDYLVQYDSGGMDVASWSNVNRFWTNHVTEPYWNCAQFQTVVAWMLLPEPYRKETEDG